MKKKVIAINGFGRIGRTITRVLLSDPALSSKISIGAIASCNMRSAQAAYLFEHDSLMGNWPTPVEYSDTHISINNNKIAYISIKNNSIPDWKQYGISWVVDASGAYTNGEQAREHITRGAQRVLITAPADNEDITIILGVNHDKYIPEKHIIISLGSCTTNAYAPIINSIDRAYTIQHSFMTTVHAYTNSQVVLDSPREELRESRAAALNIIPTSTGASRTMEKIFPHLAGRIHAGSLRVPVPKVSLLDCLFTVEKNPGDNKSCNTSFTESEIVSIAQFSGVSSDFAGNSHSVIIDPLLTHVQYPFIKIMGWYDNEWGYSCRVRDFLINCAYST